jgi:hypothetical protein
VIEKCSNFFRIEKRIDTHWKVGEIRKSTNTYNNFYKYFLTKGSYFRTLVFELSTIKEVNQVNYSMDTIDSWLENNDYRNMTSLYKATEQHYPLFKTNESTIRLEFAKIMRELLLESIRLERYEHLPSRKKCIFLAPNIESCLYWEKLVSSTESQIQVVKLKGEGKLHIGSNRFFDKTYKNFDDFYIGMENYWQYPADIKDKDAEVLYIGTLECIEILSKCDG